MSSNIFILLSTRYERKCCIIGGFPTPLLSCASNRDHNLLLQLLLLLIFLQGNVLTTFGICYTLYGARQRVRRNETCVQLQVSILLQIKKSALKSFPSQAQLFL